MYLWGDSGATESFAGAFPVTGLRRCVLFRSPVESGSLRHGRAFASRRVRRLLGN